MRFEYECQACEIAFELELPFKKSPKQAVPCIECDGKAQRVWTTSGFILKGGGWPGKGMRLNREMTARNEAAGRRMKGNTPPVKLVAHDYGNGDVREV